MSDDLAARMIEAAARAIAGERATSDAARAALAAAVREAGLDAADMRLLVERHEREAHYYAGAIPVHRRLNVTHTRAAALLRALGGIADA